MAYDEDLANRVREQLAAEIRVTEKAMFGGLVFLLAGNMAVALSGDELMVRVGADAAQDALTLPHARAADIGGRPMRGWVVVSPAGIDGDEELRGWVARGVAHARSLPAKG